jgi:hypothetical protein
LATSTHPASHPPRPQHDGSMLQTSVQQLTLSQPGEVLTSMQEPLLQI